MSTIHQSHNMIAPASFQSDAGYGQETCSQCMTCTCHDQGATLADPCPAATHPRTERSRTMPEHNHITHGDIVGCPACDKRERRLPAPEAMPPAPTSPDLSAYPEMRHRIEGGKFVCPGDENARCHRYPGDDCDHENWPCGHEYVGHAECWVKAWVDAVNLSDSYDGGLIDMPIPDAEFPDGDVIWTWEGDYVTFDYAAEQGETVDR